MELGEGIKKLLLAGIGTAAVTAEKSKEVLDELVKKGELTVEQGKVLNQELKHNIKESVKKNVNVTLKPSNPDELKEVLGKMTPDQLAAAYEELYGEELVLSEGCANAGYEFLKRLRENEPIFTSASDEVAEAVGTPGQSDPPIGFCASSKLRKNEDNGWVLAPVNLYPTTGIPAINTLYVVEGCEHPAAAKLLIRFMMGGIDGDTSGYEPFNTLGGWPVRDDIEPAEGSVPYEEMNVSPFDPNSIYTEFMTVRDFWQMLG